MIVYNHDSNTITAEPRKSKTEGELLHMFSSIFDFLVSQGHQPIVQHLDNECPKSLCLYMEEKGINLQLVPPHLHQQNMAKQAIDIWKDHFILGLASVDPSFPMHLWCG